MVDLTIIRIDGCAYCTAAHSMAANKKSGVAADRLAAVRSGTALPDPKLDASACLPAAMTEARDNSGKAVVDEFIAAGFTTHHALAMVLAIACKTCSDMVNIWPGLNWMRRSSPML